MPRKPKRPCSFPGCPNLTDGRFCEEHRLQEQKNYNRYQRDPETARRYGNHWQRIRNAYARRHPLCEDCLAEGRTTPMEQVHHVKPLREGGTNDWENLRSLCAACHARTHAQRGDRWHNH